MHGNSNIKLFHSSFWAEHWCKCTN